AGQVNLYLDAKSINPVKRRAVDLGEHNPVESRRTLANAGMNNNGWDLQPPDANMGYVELPERRRPVARLKLIFLERFERRWSVAQCIVLGNPVEDVNPAIVQ